MPISSVSSSLPSPLLDAMRRNASAQAAGATGASSATQGVTANFFSAFDQALKSVSAAQNDASAVAEAFQADPQSVSLETAMVSMQKSQIGFQSALHVRNRLVSAYSDIMNMQV